MGPVFSALLDGTPKTECTRLNHSTSLYGIIPLNVHGVSSLIAGRYSVDFLVSFFFQYERSPKHQTTDKRDVFANLFGGGRGGKILGLSEKHPRGSRDIYVSTIETFRLGYFLIPELERATFL